MKPHHLLAVALFAIAAPSHAQSTLTMGTGSETGVYFVVGNTIADIVNAADSGVEVEVLSTAGSIANIRDLDAGTLQLAVAQSDWQYHAVNGSSQFADAPVPGLKALFSVHGEPFTVLARADSGIARFEDLRGKRVNVGNPGSGQRATMQVVLDALGWQTSDFALAAELTPAEQGGALCAGDLDAIIFVAGHPNDSIHEATAFCDSQLVPVAGPEIDALIADNSYYAGAVVPRGFYASGNETDTSSFGVRATVVTTADQSEEAIYALVSTVFNNLDRFRLAHPAFEMLSPESMILDGLSAPLHPGAARYYAERGWLKPSGS